jgi:imidazolonepropionase-like amidohydrolase
MGYKRELEVAADSLRKMHQRGIRILPGGDYGFAWMPHGTNANDLQYFVDYIGMTPAEALRSATSLGGQIMQRPDELGQLKAGFLADIILVDGDPLKSLALLTDPSKINLVMKNGVIHKDCATRVPAQAALHLPGADYPLREEGIREAVATEAD